jgi:hypothetical protein
MNKLSMLLIAVSACGGWGSADRLYSNGTETIETKVADDAGPTVASPDDEAASLPDAGADPAEETAPESAAGGGGGGGYGGHVNPTLSVCPEGYVRNLATLSGCAKAPAGGSGGNVGSGGTAGDPNGVHGGSVDAPVERGGGGSDAGREGAVGGRGGASVDGGHGGCSACYEEHYGTNCAAEDGAWCECLKYVVDGAIVGTMWCDSTSGTLLSTKDDRWSRCS